MGEIVDLRDLFPDEITIVFPDGTEYSLPGDIDNDTAFNLYLLLLDVVKLDQDYADVEVTHPNARRGLEQAKKLYDRLEEILLGLFRQRHPDLERIPGGRNVVAMLTERLLREIGFLTDQEPEHPEDPPRGETETGNTGSSTTGSTRSSKSSGSPRTSGARSGTGRRARGTASAGGGASAG